MRFLNKHKLHITIFAITFAGVLLRLSYLKAPYIDSDQAIFGLQSLHVLKGEFPVFSWGYAYIGTLSSFLTAPFFSVFGVSREVLNGVTIIFYLIYLYATYLIARNLFKSTVIQLLTISLAAVTPDFFTIHGIWARHGYPETYALGSLILAFCIENVNSKSKSLIGYLVVGIIAGLGWWSNFLIIYYFCPLMILFCDNLLNFTKKHFFKCCGLFASGFFLGSFPFWYFNLLNGFSSFAMFSHSNYSGSRDIINAFVQFLRIQLPVLVGASTYDDFSMNIFSFILTVLWGGAIFFPLYITIKRIRNQRLDFRPRANEMVSVFIMAILLLFFKSRYADGKDLSSVRYMVPFYSVYPLLPGLIYMSLTKNKKYRIVFICSIMLSLIMNFLSIMKGSPFFSEKKLNDYNAVKIKEEGLFKILKQKGITKAFMYDYWVAPLFTFDSKEEFILAHVNSRYSPYVDELLSGKDLNYLVSGNVLSFRNGLKALGTYNEKEEISGYAAFTGIKPVKNNFQILAENQYKIFKNTSFRELDVLNDNNLSSMLMINQKGKQDSLEIRLNKKENLLGIRVSLFDPYKAPGKITVYNNGDTIINTEEFLPGYIANGRPYIPAAPGYFEIYFPETLTDSITLKMESFIAKAEFGVTEINLIIEDSLNGTPDLGKEKLIQIVNEKSLNLKLSTGGRAFYQRINKKNNGPHRKGEGFFDFKKPVLFIFDKDSLKHNKGFLDDINIKYSYGYDDFTAWILTEDTSWKTAVWSGKMLFKEYDRLKGAGFYKKAKDNAYNNDDAAAFYYQKVLYYLPFHYPALEYLEDYWKRQKVSLEYRKIKTVLDKFLTPAKRVLAKFSQTIAVIGLDIPEKVKAGEKYPYLLYFHFLKEKQNNFAVFVHFKAKDGEILFQDDHYLAEGDTEQFFVEGEMYRDLRVFKVPDDLDYKGKVEVWFGLWNPETGKRFKPDTSENLLQEKDNLFAVLLKKDIKTNEKKDPGIKTYLKAKDRSVKLTELEII